MCFQKKRVSVLGHIISTDGLKLDPEKYKVMKELLALKKVDEVKRFLANANFYRKFISNFAILAIPVYNRLKKKM